MPLIKILYSLIRLFFQLLYGSIIILRTPSPRITMFGGARLRSKTDYYRQAHELAHALAHKKITIITGGGSGIMQAANCGANHVQPNASIGIGIKSLHENKSPCSKQYIELDDFFARKHLLTNYSDAFIVFPGGFGTADELLNLLNLMKVGHVPKKPLILVGIDYWKPFVDWFKTKVVAADEINQEDIDLIRLVDSNEEIIDSIFRAFHIS
jgi:uncharacterized protein (TIGR00730 family)